MGWSLPPSVVPDLADTFTRSQANSLALMMQRRKLSQQQAYEQALQANVAGLGSSDPAVYRNSLADLARSGEQGAETALPLIQQERNQALIGSILGGGVGGAQTAPAAAGGHGTGFMLDRVPVGRTASAAPARVPPELLPIYQQASAKTGVPVEILIAQGAQESGFNPNAVGGAGEIGIAQIHPRTAADPGFGVAPISPEDARDPAKAIPWQAEYFAARARAKGADLSTPQGQDAGLRAYNGGGDPNYVQNVRGRLGAAPDAAQQPQTSQSQGGQDVAIMRQRANQLRLIPGGQAAASSLDQQAAALEARQAQQQQTQLALQARREDQQSALAARRQDAEERAATRREDMETRRRERVEDRANNNPAFGNGMDGRALGAIEQLAPKVADGSASDEELRRYDSAVTAYQETQTRPDGTRITPRLPSYAPGADVVQREYEKRRVAQQGAPGVAPQQNLPTAGGGMQEGTKPIPQSAQTAMMGNVDGVGKIDRALAKVDAAPGAFGAVAGALNMVPGGVQDRYAPQSSVEARAAIADIGSLVLHDRSGAAVTASEFPRLQPFIPSVSDSPETVRTKLRNFREAYLAELRNQYEVYGPGQGFKSNPVVERVLGGTGGSGAGGNGGQAQAQAQAQANPLGLRIPGAD